MGTLTPAAANRLFVNVFICRRCNAKIRADPVKVKRLEVKCRKCGYKALRLKHKTIKAKA